VSATIKKRESIKGETSALKIALSVVSDHQFMIISYLF